jgi:hypothetical protein
VKEITVSADREPGITPYRASAPATPLEQFVAGPTVRFTAASWRWRWVGSLLAGLVVFAWMVVCPWLMAVGEAAYALGLAAAIVALSVVSSVTNPAEWRLRALRRRLAALPFPTAGHDEWLDPIGAGFGALEIELKDNHPLIEQAVAKVVPVECYEWTSSTTLRVHARWSGDEADLAALEHALDQLLARHHAELGVVRIEFRPPAPR